MARKTIHHHSKAGEKAAAIELPSIASQPDEILCQIFEYVPIINRIAVSRVSKLFGRISQDLNRQVKSLMITGHSQRPAWLSKRKASFCGIKDHKFGKDWVWFEDVENIVDIVKALPNLKALDVTIYDPDIDLRPILRKLTKTNIEHIHFGGLLRDSATEFAIKRLSTSKVTCIWENGEFLATGRQVSKLDSLKFLKVYSTISVDHVRTLLQKNVTSLDFDDVWSGTAQQFCTILIANGSALETLGTRLDEDGLFGVFEGGLPLLKHISFIGTVDNLKKVLRSMPNIESVKWFANQLEWFTVTDLRDALRANGRKLKFFDAEISIYDLDENTTQFEDPMLKTIVENCPNLEHLDLSIGGEDSGLTSTHLVELSLGKYLPRIRLLNMVFSSLDSADAYKLFETMPSLIAFAGNIPGDDGYEFELVLERRGSRIIDTTDDKE